MGTEISSLLGHDQRTTIFICVVDKQLYWSFVVMKKRQGNFQVGGILHWNYLFEAEASFLLDE